MKKIIIGFIAVLMSILVLMATINLPTEDDDIEGYDVLSLADVNLLMGRCGVRDENVNYNYMVGENGTGLAPPTFDEWMSLVGTTMDNNEYSDVLFASDASFDLSSSPHFPPIKNQGGEGSCAAFAMTYYLCGYIQSVDNGWMETSSGNPSQLLSPSWTYNKCNGAIHEGSGMSGNGKILEQMGAATWDLMPYNEHDDLSYGNESAWRAAPLNRISKYVILSPTSDTLVNSVKNQLSQDKPVIFGIDAYEYGGAFTDGNFIMSSNEYNSTTFNHAQTIVGYDDTITDDGDIGSFRVANSWGAGWADSGFYWLTYNAMKEMLSFPVITIIDLPDYNPKLLATWTFEEPTTVDSIYAFKANNTASPKYTQTLKFASGHTEKLPTFMAMDVSGAYNKYLGGEKHYFLQLTNTGMMGIVDSFKLELYDNVYEPYEPSKILFNSSNVPYQFPGAVEGVISNAASVHVLEPELLSGNWYKEPVTITLVATDNVDENVAIFYRVNGSPWITYSSPFTISDEGWYLIEFYAKDAAGNVGDIGSAAFGIDMTPPTVTILINGELYNGAYNSTVNVTLLLGENESAMYRVNGGEWVSYDGNIQISEEGINTLEWYGIDENGNIGPVNDVTIKINPSDVVPPKTINAFLVLGIVLAIIAVAIVASAYVLKKK